MVTPLGQKTRLVERYQILQELGRGGFAIAYLALDQARNRRVVIKELAPNGASRAGDFLDLGYSGHLLQAKFLEESQRIRKLAGPGLLKVFDSFTANGTAYYVTEYLPGSKTLDKLLQDEDQLHPTGALDIFLQLMETLEQVHAAGIIHRDVKPSNVLVDASGRAFLIDFGAAREFGRSADKTHTAIFTPGFGAPEQMGGTGDTPRGPATDIYGLCATLYASLTGQPPPSAGERASGTPLPPLPESVEDDVRQVLESGLRLRVDQRPQSVAELRRLLGEPKLKLAQPIWQSLDDILARTDQFRYDPSSCPGCGSQMEDARPLRLGQCAACHRGVIQYFVVSDRSCPACRVGVLHQKLNHSPLIVCPTCAIGTLASRKRGLLNRTIDQECLHCGATYESRGDELTRTSPSPAVATLESWRVSSRRSHSIWQCDSCLGQWDDTLDGRRRQVLPHDQLAGAVHSRREWANVAAGLPIDSGNARCDLCAATYERDDSDCTLLSCDIRQYPQAKSIVGKTLSMEELRWIAIGKTSCRPGRMCLACHLELDRADKFWQLVATQHGRLKGFLGQSKVMEDWHRIAQGLPEINRVIQVEGEMEAALKEGYLSAQLGVENDSAIAWSGRAQRVGRNGVGTFRLDNNEISWKQPLRRWAVPSTAMDRIAVDGEIFRFWLSGETEPYEFELEPIQLTLRLASGDWCLNLSAADLAARLTH